MNYTVNWCISTSATGTTNPCSTNNGGCGHVCFPTPKGPRCGCAEGLILRETSSQCSTTMGECINVTIYVSATLPHGHDINTLKTMYSVTKWYSCPNELKRFKQLPFLRHAQQRRDTACRLLHFIIFHAIKWLIHAHYGYIVNNSLRYCVHQNLRNSTGTKQTYKKPPLDQRFA